ncbi:gliding motility lipoprotein GldD [Changchengzhania lutea]|uniref:gliding motility lipoprotein GldD n=1 Tax=Changchengzhania lutea TaxID=2049305 RepID=UPI00115CB24F|nr:gliding motility lipoprotein GldD [Changchengzhania lutea]
MIKKSQNKYVFKIITLSMVFGFVACGEDYVPKPKAYLRLEYPKADYTKSQLDLPFSFEMNKLATKIKSKNLSGTTTSYGLDIEYPTLKGTIFLTYKAIDNKKENFMLFLKDAENLTQKHMIKADEIPVTVYENKEKRVYGLFSEVKGDVASPAQFYITDSINHFLTGSLYFYAKPNYDSILPAANYLQKDMKHIMETVEWK